MFTIYARNPPPTRPEVVAKMERHDVRPAKMKRADITVVQSKDLLSAK
jgi:hypothetical protein